MRGGLVAGLMGIGGILMSFGITILIISIFTRMSVGTGSLVIGGVMFVAGYLLNRIGRSAPARS